MCQHPTGIFTFLELVSDLIAKSICSGIISGLMQHASIVCNLHGEYCSTLKEDVGKLQMEITDNVDHSRTHFLPKDYNHRNNQLSWDTSFLASGKDQL